MYKERLYFAAQHFVASNLLLMLLFLLIRSAEYFLTGLTHSFPEGASSLILYGYLFDIWYVLVLSTLMFPFYLGFYMLLGSFTKYFLFIIFTLYVLIYIGLIQYYSVTMIPLSADFWGYSAEDIKTTVNASAGISISTFLPFIIVLGILFLIYSKVQEIIMPQALVWTYGSISLVSCIVYFIFTPSATWFSNENRYTFSVNKMAYFNEKSLAFYAEKNSHTERVIDTEYPLVHDADTADVLGPFFDSLPAKPNFVFLMVEGLGGTFVGPNARYGGCTPFLDSLAQHSLYWQYFLSTTGRTFGVLPSLFGSLPYSEKGFMEMGANMPAHITLFRLLKDQGYSTRYFHGGNTNFDLQDVFLERQGIDFILGENKFPPPPAYQKLPPNSGGFSWGYSDGDVFKRSLELYGTDTTKPHLSVYMTLNTHEPFKIPDQEKYLAQLEKIATTRSAAQQADYKQYQLELSALLYTDNAIRELIEAYKKRSDYKNTIFVITGDHRMIPVTQVNRIDRFHVPFIMFSPMLKRTQMFSSISTHHDVTPTVLSLLQKNTQMRFPQKVHWLGHMIDTTREFHSVEDIALMRNKNELIDYIDHDYFLSDNILYHITPKLDLERSDDGGKLSELKEKLANFKQMNQYVFANNKIYNDSLVTAVKPEFEFTPKEEFMIKIVHADTLGPDDLFWLARKYIFAKNYYMGRIICKKALLTSPNYTDVRVLLGRSHSWNGEYDLARKYFSEAIRRMPDCSDAYSALIDMETWSENYKEAIKTADLAYGMFKDEGFILQKEKVKRIMAN